MEVKYNKNPKILNDFLYYLSVIKNYSINTIKSYSLDLLSFFNFLNLYFELNIDIKDFNAIILSKVKEADIIAFLVYLNFTKDNTATSRQRKLSSIRSFYKWLFGHYPAFNEMQNPCKNIPNIEPVIRLPKYLTLEQSKKISEIFTLENSKHPLRNNTIIFLFLNTGMRLSELSNLNVNDINFDEKYIRIIEKRNKERKIFINEITKQQLLKYLRMRNKDKLSIAINEPLFISHQNKRLGIDGVSDVCKKAFELMGLKDYGYTTHTLRHTFATIMYQYVKPDILLLKELLGHSLTSTTQIYTHISNEKVKHAVDNNPLNKIDFEKVA